MAYITKTSQLQDLQSINVFLQVRGIKMFQLVTRFEKVSKMNVGICSTMSTSRKGCNFIYHILVCLESGSENQVVHVKLSPKTGAFAWALLLMFVWIVHLRQCCLYVCLVGVFA